MLFFLFMHIFVGVVETSCWLSSPNRGCTRVKVFLEELYLWRVGLHSKNNCPELYKDVLVCKQVVK